jgi:predicted PurR-regulated permease PerM
MPRPASQKSLNILGTAFVVTMAILVYVVLQVVNNGNDAVDTLKQREQFLETLEDLQAHADCVDKVESEYEIAVGNIVNGAVQDSNVAELQPALAQAIGKLTTIDKICKPVNIVTGGKAHADEDGD